MGNTRDEKNIEKGKNYKEDIIGKNTWLEDRVSNEEDTVNTIT